MADQTHSLLGTSAPILLGSSAVLLTILVGLVSFSLAFEERKQLIPLTSAGKASARTIKHANVLLLPDARVDARTADCVAGTPKNGCATK